jgi:hypothetical protein
MKKGILALSLLALVFTSCKKDDDEPQQITPTKENVTGSYKITAMTINGIDFWSSLDACEKDDVYKANADLSFDRQDAGTVCSPDNSYTGGTWSISGSTVNFNDEVSGTITSWDGSTMVVTDNSSSPAIVVTLRKQ